MSGLLSWAAAFGESGAMPVQLILWIKSRDRGGMGGLTTWGTCVGGPSGTGRAEGGPFGAFQGRVTTLRAGGREKTRVWMLPSFFQSIMLRKG